MIDVIAVGVRLSIDYGSVTTTALLTWPDGRWTPLSFDGSPLLSSAVYVDTGGELLTGTQAWQHTAAQPQHFLTQPKRLIRAGAVSVAGREMDALDLIAATLRRVAMEAVRVAGQPIGEVRLVVPAGWGPNRRTAMRTAAHRAGLAAPTLVEAPVAAVDYLLATGVVIPIGAAVLICDYGADTETTLLRRTPNGCDVLATMSASDAGGDQIDRDLAAQLADWSKQTISPAAPGTGLNADDVMVMAAARSGKESLAAHAALAIPLPAPHPPIMLTAARLDALATPALTRAAQLARATLDAVDEVTPDQLAGVYCVGGGAHLPAAVRLLGEHLSRPVSVVPDPHMAVVLGAAQATDSVSPTKATADEPPLPPVRRALALLVPGLGSLALVFHAYASAHLEGQPGLYDPNAYVLANWGELALASVLALITCLAAGTLIASVVPAIESTRSDGPAAEAGAQIGTALLIAIAISLSVGGLYAIAGSVYFGLSDAPFLRWALIAQIPIALAVVAAAALATRLHRAPPGGWHVWLNFPTSSVLCAAVGTILIQYSMSATRYDWDETLINLAGRVGAVLLGVGAGLVASRALYRILIAVPLAVFAAAIVSWPATGVLAAMYIAAVTMWWMQCIWKLVWTGRAGRSRTAYGGLGQSTFPPATNSSPADAVYPRR